jgi:hypothetical protein
MHTFVMEIYLTVGNVQSAGGAGNIFFMTLYIIKWKKINLYMSRRGWTKQFNKARIYTGINHAKNSVYQLTHKRNYSDYEFVEVDVYIL